LAKGSVAKEKAKVKELAAKEMGKGQELELANWYPPHLQPTALPGSRTKRQLPEHEALQIASQCCRLNHTWCHSEGKLNHLATLQYTRQTHQAFSTKRGHQR
jgi:hypothetical protein